MPSFFVPGQSGDQAETTWRQLREECGGESTTERRIFGIAFRHNARECIAQVGEPIMYLVGELPNPIEQPFVQDSQVLAIFERDDKGLYFICWHTDDKREYARVNNPFLVGAADARIEDFS